MAKCLRVVSSQEQLKQASSNCIFFFLKKNLSKLPCEHAEVVKLFFFFYTILEDVFLL